MKTILSDGKHLNIYLSALALLTVVSCGKDPRGNTHTKNYQQATKNATPVKPVATFPIDSLKKSVFAGPTVFLWKKDITADKVANVLRALRTMDLNEDLVVQLNKLEGDLAAKPNDPDLTSQINRMVEKDCPNIKKWQKENSHEDAPCSKDLLRNRVDEENGNLLGVLVENVDFLESDGNPKLVFDVDQQSQKLNLSVQDILFPIGDKNSDVKEYDQKQGNLINLNYEERGGVISFDLLADRSSLKPVDNSKDAHQFTYQFKVHRTNYDDLAGRKLFKGDMVLKETDGEGKLISERRGQIKFSDRNN